MARIRTIKPEFWDDEHVALLPMPCRLFFIGCWNFADDFGVIRGNPVLLKSQIFPYDENLRVSELKKWLDALVNARFLVPISHEDKSYYLIRTFQIHQVLDSRYSKSYIGKEIANDVINRALKEHNELTTFSRRVDVGGNGNGNGNGNGKESKKTTNRFSPPSVLDVQSFISENHYSVDAISFVNYYQSKDWMIGKNKIKDWMAAVRTWQQRDQTKDKNNGTTKEPSGSIPWV